MELNKIMITMIFGIVIFLGIFNFMADGVIRYSVSVPADYNESVSKIRGVFDNINQTTYEMKEQMTSIGTSSNPLDILGVFFSGGYAALKSVMSLINGFGILIDTTLNTIFVGEIGNILKIALYLSFIIIIVVGILLHAITKSDRN